MKAKITIPVKEFKVLLNSVKKIRTSVLIKIKDNKLIVLAASDANLIYVLSAINLPDKDDNDKELELPIADITKLLRICDFAESSEITLDICDNIVKFKNSNVNIKFYLAEQLIISVPDQVTPEGFDKFKIDFECELTKDKLSQLERAHSFVSGTVSDIKLYFYLDSNKFYGEVGDRLTVNTDSLSVHLNDTYSGYLSDILPIKFDLWSLLAINSESVKFKASKISRRGMTGYVLFIEQDNGVVSTRYLMKSVKG